MTRRPDALPQAGTGITGALRHSDKLRKAVSRRLRAALTLSRLPSTAGSRAIYDAAAPLYSVAQGMWLLLAGGQAQERLHRELKRRSASETAVLDVDSGDGRSAARLGALLPDAKIVLTDISAGMLSTAEPAWPRVQADATRLPFRDSSFDLVVAAWSLETMKGPDRALDECMRVAAPSGMVGIVYCSLPQEALYELVTRPVRWLVAGYFGGRFLDVDLSPSVGHEELYRWSTPSEPASVAIFRKPVVIQA